MGLETELKKGTVLSGMRPTDKNLHIGHVEGVLRNWIELQNKYNPYYFVADWHALTTNLNSRNIKENTVGMVRDWLATGVDPKKSTIFIQSQIPEHAELHLALSMLAGVTRLERLPNYKELLRELNLRETCSYGFLGYPVLMAGDILLYKGNKIPVGEDQVSHVELTREIAKKFNNTYGELFPIPEVLLSQTPRILGVDGRKMSKSYGNAIYPTDEKDVLQKKIMRMVTDPARKRIKDPGDPNKCSVFDLHLIYNNENNINNIIKSCTNAEIGCKECKNLLPEIIYKEYSDFRERRLELEKDPKKLKDVLKQGTLKARQVASDTIKEVKKYMLIDHFQ